ncbi:hypothetical protein Gogos_000050 [Gossypium gossypioides]|uniref:Uncharacterized protein n=1 Tax=Gossypium gossypioides TaxID=34282 RepID=A0A7J9CYN2_GOSGO|nr:hypothetical protein [Gossypium gossypioides]
MTLEDVQLQLGLPVDGSIFTGFAQSTDCGAICYHLLGAILDIIYGGTHLSDPRRLFDAGQVMKPRTFDVAIETHRF